MESGNFVTQFDNLGKFKFKKHVLQRKISIITKIKTKLLWEKKWNKRNLKTL